MVHFVKTAEKEENQRLLPSWLMAVAWRMRPRELPRLAGKPLQGFAVQPQTLPACHLVQHSPVADSTKLGPANETSMVAWKRWGGKKVKNMNRTVAGAVNRKISKWYRSEGWPGKPPSFHQHFSLSIPLCCSAFMFPLGSCRQQAIRQGFAGNIRSKCCFLFLVA